MPRFYDLPFTARVLLLAALLGVLAIVDLRRHGRRSTRWREYAFLFAAGAVAAIAGALNDLLTSALSREYFVFGKGLPDGPDLRLRALELGAHAGFVAGALAACGILWANTARPPRPPVPYRRLARRCAHVLAAALAGGIAGGLVARALASSAGRAERDFATVQGIHGGLYLGLLSGTLWLMSSVWRHARGPRRAD